ncbi:hypothetical protein ASF70_12975 [Rhizobium sp. Leaf321]|uniref:hypothetical protein n=1 Tax=Rhizobium sp. Leaf321 TaxID=1736335 RepID=UPI000713EFA4|nr:hypothetical protein [Rhizobium sp. Leaf321]KQQ72437.1 hypothetical protein ASF70_12975 [Rhizobium sp. Leaf321]
MKSVLGIAAVIGALLLPNLARADFIDTTWTVIGWSGEAWFSNTKNIVGKSQKFYKGEASGIFYSCDNAGQSSTYTTYETVDAFLANPEFELFKPAEKDLRLSGPKVFVHRITCDGGSNPAKRRVLYPFVTTEKRHSAYYLYEGGYFSMYAP